MISSLINSLVFALVVSLMTMNAAQAHEDCETIRFQRGNNGTVVKGVAPPDSVICYVITTAEGQIADVTVLGVNMMFSVEGVIDAQDKYQFSTEKKTYRINVGQLMRSVTDQPFTLEISIK